MSIQINLKINNVCTFIDPPISGSLYAELKKRLGYMPENSLWISNNSPHWDGWITTVCYGKGKCRCPNKKSEMHFPTGLLSVAREFFNEKGIHANLIDLRQEIKNFNPLELSEAYKLRDYQESILNKSLKKQRGIIRAATGAGKTVLAGSIIAKAGAFPACFFVTTIDLLNQAKEEMEKLIMVNGKPAEIGVVGGGKCDIKDINVVTVQTAIRALGKKFEKFDDEEDGTHDSSNVGEDNKHSIKELINNCQLYIADECITGDSLVVTKNNGLQKIVNLNNMIGEDVLSFDGTSVVWKKITNFYDQGVKDILEIELNSGDKLKCTENHPIMTERGWVYAGMLRMEDKILFFANAAAKQKFSLREKVLVNIQNMFSGIKCIPEVIVNGKKYLTHLRAMLLCANVVVVKKLCLSITLLAHLLKIKVVKNIENIYMATTKDQALGVANCQAWKSRQYLEHCLVTHLLYFLPKEVKMQGFNGIMDWFKGLGLNIRHLFYKNYQFVSVFVKIKVMAHILYLLLLHVCLLCLKYTTLFTIMVKKRLQENGLTQLVKSVLHGGFVMMDALEDLVSSYIQRVFLYQRLSFVPNGFLKNMEKSMFFPVKKNIIYSVSQKKQEAEFTKLLKNTYQNACSTKFVGIKKIKKVKSEKVFDITVDKTHCFFANGMLVHNCQHWAANTCQIVSDYCSNARYRFGISATPWRDMSDDILIDACFGKQIADINASMLISKGVLVPPKIYFVHVKSRLGGVFADVYKKGIVENMYRNNVIKNLADQFVKEGRQTLILVRHISHGEILQEMIPNSVFLHGSVNGKNRQDAIKKMKDGKHMCVIASSIFDEGVDVRPLSALILAGAGKSPTRALQRIGRVIRCHEGKKDAIIVDFFDEMKYMKKHSQSRRKIYKTEPKFEIFDIESDITYNNE